jgi:hypothetical protein
MQDTIYIIDYPGRSQIMSDISRPEIISRFKKQRFLLAMSEDRFRDEVVRPLFLRQGFGDGRDLCGPSEKGKDALFVATDKLGIEDVYVIQTKAGNINLARKASANVVEAITQLRTASQTKVNLLRNKKSQLPAKVILCASGNINDSARAHITQEVSDPRLVFLDADELIPKIDELFPELWLGIDSEIAPYFRKLKKMIENSDDSLAMAEILPSNSQIGVATDQGFVMLQLYQMGTKMKKERGQLKRVPDFVQIPIVALLKNKKQTLSVVFGTAGSGKSTSLKRLAYILASRGLRFESQQRPVVPILLRAPDIASDPGISMVAHCDAESKRITGLSSSSFSAQDLQAGRVFILIDALDEVPEEGGRTSVLASIKQFHQMYPACPVVVTSRDYDTVKSLAALKNFEAYTLSPINHKQAHQMLKTLQKGKNLPLESSQEIVRRLEEVHGMELNPLLVTIFAATSDYSRQDIPANITELFKKFTEMMLGRWDATKGFKHQYHAPLKDFILTKIAFEMHKEKQTKISVERFDSILRKELGNRGYDADIPQLRDEIINRSGLFIVLGESIEFRHLMMQEFFAGRGISSGEYLNSIVTDPWWKRALIFYFGDNPGNSDALHHTIAALQERTVEEKYHSAIALGLALQACYLVEIKDKVTIYEWVVGAISDAKEEFLSAAGETKKSPVSWFVFYYLFGRDSVALSVLKSKAQELWEKWKNGTLSTDDKDTRMFWLICGLIECGAMLNVEELVKDFKPADARLLLAISMGSYLLQHVRISPKPQRDAADRVCSQLAGRIGHLRSKLLEEFRTDLLEVREGAVKAIEVGGGADKKDDHESQGSQN